MSTMDDERERTLYCGNLCDPVTEELLYELFLQAGPIEKACIRGEKGRKFAFITFKHTESIAYTINLMNGMKLLDRNLNLKPREGTVQATEIHRNTEMPQIQRTYSAPVPLYGNVQPFGLMGLMPGIAPPPLMGYQGPPPFHAGELKYPRGSHHGDRWGGPKFRGGSGDNRTSIAVESFERNGRREERPYREELRDRGNWRDDRTGSRSVQKDDGYHSSRSQPFYKRGYVEEDRHSRNDNYRSRRS